MWIYRDLRDLEVCLGERLTGVCVIDVGRGGERRSQRRWRAVVHLQPTFHGVRVCLTTRALTGSVICWLVCWCSG